MSASVNKQFVSVSAENLCTLDDAKDSSNTKRIVNRSVKLFRTYLGAENANFEQMPKYALNNHLRMFFASIRTVKGEELKKSTMYSVKYGLSKYLKEKGRIDISTDNDFVTAIKTFKAKLTDLQKKGKGSVVHKPQIADYDMKKLMDPANVAFNVNTPCGLQNKVWFDIMYNLCLRGRENLREMKKTTFAVEVDSSGREYVRQIMDEADKNHGIDSTPDDTIGEARMYARPCDDMCPVKNFKRYMSRLHPDLDDLWQRPRDSFNTTDDCWFCKSPLGRNLLGNMMSQISTTAALSQNCIRATSISALDMAGFEARQIIRATGHKSETSIKSYASRLTEGTKREMSDALSSAFLGAEQNAPMTSDIVPELSALDLDQIFPAKNDFSEVSRPIPTSEADMTTRGVLDQSFVTTHVSVDHSTNVVHIIPGSPQIINIPNRGGEQAYYNVTPQMSNCNVNFHFHGR